MEDIASRKIFTLALKPPPNENKPTPNNKRKKKQVTLINQPKITLFGAKKKEEQLVDRKKAEDEEKIVQDNKKKEEERSRDLRRKKEEKTDQDPTSTSSPMHKPTRATKPGTPKAKPKKKQIVLSNTDLKTFLEKKKLEREEKMGIVRHENLSTTNRIAEIFPSPTAKFLTGEDDSTRHSTEQSADISCRAANKLIVGRNRM